MADKNPRVTILWVMEWNIIRCNQMHILYHADCVDFCYYVLGESVECQLWCFLQGVHFLDSVVAQCFQYTNTSKHDVRL